MKYTYTFDQLREVPELVRDRLFLSYEDTVRRFGAVDPEQYFTADFGVAEAPDERCACERLYRTYNCDKRPEGYHGRSMSVSDIVNLWNNELEPPVKTSWFCDSFGFVKLSEGESPARMCPACGNEYVERPALSRRDNRTSICPDCGTREALEDLEAHWEEGGRNVAAEE